MLCELNEEDLEKMGISALFDRKRILKYIKKQYAKEVSKNLGFVHHFFIISYDYVDFNYRVMERRWKRRHCRQM